MNRKELVKKIAQKYDVTQEFAMQMCDAVFDTVNEELSAGNDVYIFGFGTFKNKVYKGKNFRHPVTKEIVQGEDKKVIVFRRPKATDKEN